MADEIDHLLDKIEDPALGAELRKRIDELRRRRTFGLVFEDHLPERVRLPEHPIRRGMRVVPRDDPDRETMEVSLVLGGTATVVSSEGSISEVATDGVVAVAEFGDPIFPGLERLGAINRGGEKPAHVVINAENHHALEMLRFTHAGKVDCIYIDPPYNTRDRDWKYDNNYVDTDDAYRHSKWLAFMKRRLRLAKDLLNPSRSVLVITIDENEMNRLVLLVEQMFPAASIQLVTVVMNRAGSPRPNRLTRVEEYAVFVFIGNAAATGWTTNLLFERGPERTSHLPTVWFSAIRVGSRKALRSYYADTTLFYPVLLDAETGRLDSVGASLPNSASLSDYSAPSGLIAVWPVSQGREQTWRFSREKMVEFFDKGTARLGRRDPQSGMRAVTYLRPGTIKAIEAGQFRVTGRTEEGWVQLAISESIDRPIPPATVWNQTSHYARDHGSKLLARFVPGRDFPFPKSLYAVEDALRVAVGTDPHAVVLDFFAGSGTSAHAVARLNRQDAGRRQAILVTNNEVSADEAKSLTARGFRDGDVEWEALGIFDHITRPRITAAITGRTPDGNQVKGDYRFVDEFPMSEGFEENVEFMRLTYQDPLAVELNAAFEAVAPMLWMRGGSQGPVIGSLTDEAGEPVPFASTDRYGVLFDADQWRPFVDALADTVRTVFVVTDSTSTFAGIAAVLPGDVEAVRLYENYLQTFAINQATT